MVTKTIRISEDQAQFLTANFKNISAGITECIEAKRIPSTEDDTLKYIRLYSIKELKAKFIPSEWLFFADSLNGSMVEGMFRCNQSALIAHCEDAQLYEYTADKYKIDLPALLDKIKVLTGAQVDALYSHVEGFWNTENGDLNIWSTEL